jgi:hypothetical protein
VISVIDSSLIGCLGSNVSSKRVRDRIASRLPKLMSTRVALRLRFMLRSALPIKRLTLARNFGTMMPIRMWRFNHEVYADPRKRRRAFIKSNVPSPHANLTKRIVASVVL